jgi:dihydroxyacetone kinase-like protein
VEEALSHMNIDSKCLIEVIKEVAQDLKEYTEDLRQLDAQLGDGDLGVTIELASRALLEYLENTAETDIGKLLNQCGMNINLASPSTFGTILASAFLGAGKTVIGKTQIGPEGLILVCEGAIQNIQKRGKAEVGDKTMLDVLVPAVEVLKMELSSGKDFKTVIDAVKKAAEKGMYATKDMQAKFGRASWFQERSIGIRDAGATAMYYMIESITNKIILK